MELYHTVRKTLTLNRPSLRLNVLPSGVVHHDDLIYLFYISKLFPEFKQNDPESVTVDKITTLWANFARTGYVQKEIIFACCLLGFVSEIRYLNKPKNWTTSNGNRTL